MYLLVKKKLHRENKMNVNNMTMISNRLLVKPIGEESKTAGGIIIPQVAKDKPTKGTVVVAGPGRISDKGELIPNSVKVGDTILYPKNKGLEIKIEKDE